MYQSENIHELAVALSKAQGEMQAAIKDRINPFFKTKYADLGSVWDAARPVLSKNGLCVMQTTRIVNLGSVDKIILVTTLVHSSGQWISSELPLNPAKNDSQGVGAAITYLRRYSLSALVGVVCDDEDDGETAVGRGKTTPPKDPSPKTKDVCESIDVEQISCITSLTAKLDQKEYESFLEMIKKNFNADSISSISKSCFDQCIRSINAKIKYMNDQNRAVA